MPQVYGSFGPEGCPQLQAAKQRCALFGGSGRWAQCPGSVRTELVDALYLGGSLEFVAHLALTSYHVLKKVYGS